MVERNSINTQKPLSYADQSYKERGHREYCNFNTNLERLVLPKESSWTTVAYSDLLEHSLGSLEQGV